jgi:hydrogenase expression/formation protein HypD
MKYLDEFRDPQLARQLLAEIRSLVTQRWVLMDVCGGQTHSLLRHGIEEALSDKLELIHGPGCPVCVTSVAAIDWTQQLAVRPEVIVTSFGDMLRVPGSRQSLLETRAKGGMVRVVYSPLEAVALAKAEPEREIIFLAVGFETTAPATALAILQAQQQALTNFSMIVAHVRVLPAMRALMESPAHQVQGFLGAGHVCAVTGYEDYGAFVDEFQVPVVITGFEPIDLLLGIRELVQRLESGQPALVNAYGRSVRPAGNQQAKALIDKVYRVVDSPWRGLGLIPQGGFALQPDYRAWDASLRFPQELLPAADDSARCLSEAVLSGRIKPVECPEFGVRCHPERPLGAPMVSSEGACAAYYRYRPAAEPGLPIIPQGA